MLGGTGSEKQPGTGAKGKEKGKQSIMIDKETIRIGGESIKIGSESIMIDKETIRIGSESINLGKIIKSFKSGGRPWGWLF